MNRHLNFVTVGLAVVVFALINAAAFGAGASGNGMRPKTAAPIMKRINEAPPARTPWKHPLVAPPMIIDPVGLLNKVQEGEAAVKRAPTAKRAPATKTAPAAKRACSDINQCSFVERFTSRNDRWLAADGYANGNPFDAWWSKNRAVIDLNAGLLKLSVRKVPRFGKQYVAGQLQTTKWHGYGCYEVRMKPVTQQGLITTFFTYTGRYDKHPGATSKHNEVDIEFVYRRNQGKFMMQTNYFTNGRGGNEHFVSLPFAPQNGFHNYGFRWGPNKIEWYADGRKVYTATRDIPKASNGNHKIMMNFWPVQARAAGWGGFYQYRGPRTALYQAVRFTRGANCRIHNSF